ncbi:MAG: translocation/assembly module TamB [Flavobacteriales bacterium]|nr:translocation/assembly module TamB [Flavobacteriales bacterium]MCX7768854.1 translocation/assembly module TamB [Flavobacteriales bacterium]MDW8410872.1 translocation/assembly module TamB domain-containing protein [Flavobacteriales bacterium]
MTPVKVGMSPAVPEKELSRPTRKGSWRRIFFRLAWSFFLIFLLFAFFLRFSWVQTWIAQRLAHWFTARYGFVVKIDRVDIGLVSGVKLEGLVFLDHHQDTLLTARSLQITLADVRPWRGVLRLGKATVSDGFIQLRRYAGEDKLNIEEVIDRVAPQDTVPDTLPPKPFYFSIEKVHLQSFGFRMRDASQAPLKTAFQPGEIRADIGSAVFRNFRVSGDSILAHVVHLEAQERCGLGIDSLACDFGICSTALFFDNLHLKTSAGTQLEGRVRMLYKDYSKFSEFLDSVRWDVALRPSRILPKDLAFFAPLPGRFTMPVGLTALVQGPVSALRIRNLSLLLPAHTLVEGSLDTKGLPDLENLFVRANVRRIQTDFEELPEFLGPLFGVELPSWISGLGLTEVQGQFEGQLHNFKFEGSVASGWGNLGVQLRWLSPPDFSRAEYAASLQLEKFNLSPLPGAGFLGPQTGHIELQGSGLTLETFQARITGSWNVFTLLGYPYQNLQVNGQWRSRKFEGKVKMNDPHVMLRFQGTLDVSRTVPAFDCEAWVGGAHLDKLGLISEPLEIEELALRATASGVNPDNFLGELLITPLRLCNRGRVYEYATIQLQADTAADGKRHFRLSSAQADADFQGYFRFVNLAHTAMRQLNTYVPSLKLPADTSLVRKDQVVDFSLHLKEPDLIVGHLAPEWHLEPGAKVQGRFDGRRSMFLTDVIVPGFATPSLKAQHLKLRLSSNYRNFYVEASAGKFYPLDSLFFFGISATVSAENDSLEFSLGWLGDSEGLSSGLLQAGSSLSRPGQYTLHFQDSRIVFAGETWKLREGAVVRYDSSGLFFNEHFLFTSPLEANIGLQGKAGYSQKNVLRILINDFPLDYVNRLAGLSKKVQWDGYISGYAGVFSALKNPHAEADLLIGQIRLNNREIGDLYFKSNYNPEEEEIILDAYLENRRDRLLSLMGGKVVLRPGKEWLNAPIIVEKLPLAVLEIFTAPDFQQWEGYLTGFIQIKGTFSAPELEGRLRAEHAAGYIPAIGGRYTFSFPSESYINLSPRIITLPVITLTDLAGHRAFLSGEITHNRFSNMRFNISLDSKGQDFIFFNPTRRESPQLYGTALAKGKIFLRGSPEDVKIIAAIESSRGTRLFISLEEGTLVASENTYVTFTSTRSTSHLDQDKKRGKDTTGVTSSLTLIIEAEVTPEAEINLVFNEATHDVLTASGSGNLRVELTPAGDIFIFGDYEVVKGKYRFSLQNLVSKELQLKPGGVITFSGDPTEARINATAYYATRASPAPLLSASSVDEAHLASARNRVPVEVLVHLKGPIREPQVAFDVEFPTVSENTRASYQAVLNTADEKNKQAFSLLVLNQFLSPGTMGSSISGGGALGSNSLEVISNQLSNLVSKFSDDLDVGVRYRQGSKTGSGSDEVEVALSTRLLDDRLIIDGNFGFATHNRNTSASSANAQNSGSIIDINIEYLLTRQGNLRLRAFNRSNYANLFSPFPYTQGAGLGFQTQFSRWESLLPRKRKDKKSVSPLILDEFRPLDE